MQEKHHKQSFNLYYDCCKKMVVEPHLRQLLSLFQHPKMLKIKTQKMKPIRSQGKKEKKKSCRSATEKKKKGNECICKKTDEINGRTERSLLF